MRAEPFSFLASEEDDVCLGLDFVRHVLHRESVNTTFGVFQPGALVGIIGIGSESKRKAAHKARLMGLYVRHEARGSGIGKALVKAAVAYARTLDGVTHLTLVVSEHKRPKGSINSSALLPGAANRMLYTLRASMSQMTT